MVDETIRFRQRRRAANIRKIAVALDQTVEEVRRQQAKGIAEHIIAGTPVDTGTARASWNLSTGQPDYTITLTGRQSRHRRPGVGATVPLRGGISVVLGQAGSDNSQLDSANFNSIGEKVANLKIGAENKIFLANGVPWIVPLEFGHSQQQPNGWVRNAINDLTIKLRAEAAAANKARKLGLRIRA